jgi:hypothetical protein
MRAAETFIPRFAQTMPLAMLSGDDKSAGRTLLEGLGMNVIEYKPEEDLGKTVKARYSNVLNEARQDWSNFVASQRTLKPETVVENFIDINSAEQEAWAKARDKILAAEAAGLPRRKVSQILKDSDLNTLQVSSLMRGRYTPTGVSLDKLDGDKQEELKKAKSLEDRQRINKKYRFLRGQIIKLNRNYKMLED